MPLINAKCGGVAYSRNPLDIEDRRVMIHSVFGLPGPVADGSADADLFIVSRDKPMRIVESEIACKTHRVVCKGKKGVATALLSMSEQRSSSIDDERALELARQVLMIEEYFGSPQDVEWAIEEDGSIVLLQSRVLVQRKKIKAQGDGASMVGEGSAEVIVEGEVTASQGAAAGPVHIVKQEIDMLHFPEGGVLVASQALPNWAVTLKSVSAVVTEQGGVAGHLANVARELRIPALFGVKQATRILEPGRIVTVDADSKKIYNGRIESLLVEQPKPLVDWNEDSPIYEALENMAKHIIPLHLLDPDDREKFSPGACTTLHDITRFCHEKSVREMFRFGKEHRFPERSAKRLVARVPTQFWIIDLKDGFQTGTASRNDIMLEDVVSVPMLALWYGMMTIPWEGPPVDARGFLEVLMESTANPGLNPSMPSPYAERNYFMVTKKYCSCQTRFGYHFSTVEALVGDRRHEKYISFNFRGGAANQVRRQRRARLVADILEEHDLRVHLVKDSVHAQLEKFDLKFMEKSLKVVGYLMLHTRQLDMVLKDDGAVEYYQNKITKDLDLLLSDKKSEAGSQNRGPKTHST
jgi:pyruvate,water dikinase